jgi:hypothetical protein
MHHHAKNLPKLVSDFKKQVRTEKQPFEEMKGPLFSSHPIGILPGKVNSYPLWVEESVHKVFLGHDTR